MTHAFDPDRLRAELISARLGTRDEHEFNRLAQRISGRHEREVSRWSRRAAETVDQIGRELEALCPAMRETMAFELRRRDRQSIRDGVGFVAAAVTGDVRRAAETAHGWVGLRRELDRLTRHQPGIVQLSTN